ncbi:hypothetical protein LEP48_00570 [Isoptericola sp. NEAU-Y5]|uniref:S1 motif domain-containing protein n=1 Tax=Isoptericola luteus TaxID=2879484 RepID=A0ABS7Z9W2_9MICO|nr:hypothetical protein [Isoptericola sp. NEAU-Y5]MCA5891843.1 hypothetical protein [Isoptericola sp. NEAU-Y5]
MPKRHRAREQRHGLAQVPGAVAARPSTTPSRPPAGVVQVVTRAEAHELAAALLTPGRRWPVAVVSTPVQGDGPYVDVDALKAEVGDLAEVVLVPTGDTSWAFSETMPPRTQVYGGASRVYGVELDWTSDPYRSRLRFAYTATDGERVRELLVHDVLAAALRAGLVGTSDGEATAADATGTVRGVVGGRGLVDLDDGGQVAVAEELTVAGIPLTQVVTPGQRVRGVVDRGARLLDLRPSLPDDEASRRLVQSAYRVGDVVLVRVREAERDAVTVELAPRFGCRVPRGLVTGNDLDHLDDLFSPGEVVLARTVASPGGLAVRLDDVDDADDVPVPALALLAGGPPWLVPAPAPSAPEPAVSTAAVSEAAVSEAAGSLSAEAGPVDGHVGGTAGTPDLGLGPIVPATTAPPPPTIPSPAHLAQRARGTHPTMPRPAAAHPGPFAPAAPSGDGQPGTSKKALQDAQLALAEARARAARAEQESMDAGLRATQLAKEGTHLLAEIQHLRGQVERLENQVREQKKKYRLADKRRQQAQREHGDAVTVDGPWFTDPADQFRHEIYDAWVRTVVAGEKAALPLGRYTLGPRFLDSLGLDGVSRRKVVETVVHVVTGRDRDVGGLQLHQLRTSDGGGTPQRTRDDGAGCWRVSLQVNSPQARRLHYWKLPDGTVELSRVVLHDDVEP